MATTQSHTETKLQSKPPQEVSQAVKDTKNENDQPPQPGVEHAMKVQPSFIHPDYKGSEQLSGKVALITGGDSGIGRAVALHFAREGAKGIVIVYKSEQEDKDASDTSKLVEKEGSKCVKIRADVSDAKACKSVVSKAIDEFGQLDVVVNNAGEQHTASSILDITPEQLQSTFATNVLSMFYIVQAALPHLKEGANIINTTSVVAYKGHPILIDYSTSKGAVVAFTRSLAQHLVEKGIRVNAVAPGPIWTSLIPATMGLDVPSGYGMEVPMKRSGQPAEVAPSYVFLASNTLSSFISGQILHPNGGTVLNV